MDNVLRGRDASEGPLYGRNDATGKVYAVFGQDKGVEIRAGRGLSYPGLATEAPPTKPFYMLAAGSGWRELTVLDAGCGCGDGARILGETGCDAAAVNPDPHAAAFASEWALGARTHRGTI